MVAEVAMAELVDRVFKIKPLAVVPGLLDIVAMEAGEDMQVPVPLRDLAEVVGAVPKVIAFRLGKRAEEVEEWVYLGKVVMELRVHSHVAEV